jgi:spermidine/putrescine transport system permease protein
MMPNRYPLMRLIFPVCVGCLYFFLYVPIILVIIFSFNKDPFACQWTGFTCHWYRELWHNNELWHALKNSLIVAFSAVLFTISMGTLLVFYGKPRYLNRCIAFFYATLAVPEIVLAVGLLTFFYFFSLYLGLPTLIAAHTLIGLGYVVPILHTHYLEIDKRIIEASYDLGATQKQTFRYIVLPLLLPAIITGALLVFIISFDDFLLSLFCTGTTSQTLPIYIFTLIRSGTSSVANALSTVLLTVSSLLMTIFFTLHLKKTDLLS